MPVSRGMRRLLRVLESEEEQRRAEMEVVLAEVRSLEQGLAATETRSRLGRRLITASAATGELADRLAGLEETREARCAGAVLRPRIAEAQAALYAKRAQFLSKRTERRQAEAVIQRVEAVKTMEAARRTQREQDDRFLSKVRPGKARMAPEVGPPQGTTGKENLKPEPRHG